MSKQPFTKPATTYQEQVEILRDRGGMIIDDPVQAAFYLEHLNYYRLGAYWLPFEADHERHIFKPNTRFETILELYRFDRELRLLCMDAIERIEVSVRAKWAFEMAHRHGSHAHLNREIIKDNARWLDNLASLIKEVRRSRETFIDHLQTKYQESLPPVWAVCEVMSLGLLSKWYANLKDMPTRRAIAKAYGLDEEVLESWLDHVNLIRNFCAHHSRLWNRALVKLPKTTQNKPAALSGEFIFHAVDASAAPRAVRGRNPRATDTDGKEQSRNIYNTLIILLYWMDIISPESGWRGRLKVLLNNHTQNLPAMDFPSNWQSRPIWQDR